MVNEWYPNSDRPKIITCSRLGLLALNSVFTITPRLRAVFRTIPIFHDGLTYLTYQAIVNFTALYIRINKDRLFRDHDILNVYCEGDLLGHALGVPSFHRDEATELIRNQIDWPVHYNYIVNKDKGYESDDTDAIDNIFQQLHIDV